MGDIVGYVFGYGSLSNRDEDPAARRAQIGWLSGYRRVWNVAMDNALEIRGYKRYRDPRDGLYPSVFVTFLNLEPAVGVDCVGALLPVEVADLERLDRRERNYRRALVPEALVADDTGARPELPVWVYLGSEEARERYQRGLACGTAVVRRRYLEIVERGFEQLGLSEQYRASTLAPECPVRDLWRVNT